MKRYTCIFPGLYNYILTKDVGMIPYTLSSEYQTVIATYANDKYTYLEDTLQSTNFKLDYMEKTENEKTKEEVWPLSFVFPFTLLTFDDPLVVFPLFMVSL